jgi:hypothetical protein
MVELRVLDYYTLLLPLPLSNFWGDGLVTQWSRCELTNSKGNGFANDAFWSNEEKSALVAIL